MSRDLFAVRRPRRRPRTLNLWAVVDCLEERQLLTGPTIDPIAAVSLPATKTEYVPVHAADPNAGDITYVVTSSNPAVQATVRSGHPYLKLSVANYGDMVFQLFDDVAPATVARITQLVNSGFYNNLTFHRVVPNFVIQGGDPNGNGTGGSGVKFSDEFNPQTIFSGTGQLAMANSGKDTNDSQFFVTVGPQRALDFNHTIFGQLVEGQSVLNAIDNAPADSSSRPLTPIVITSAQILASDPNDTVLFLQAPSGSGSSTITVTATDAQGQTDTQTFTASYAPDTTNDPPILGAVGDQTTAIGSPTTFPLSSTDLEGDPVEYRATVLNPSQGTATVSGNKVTVTPAAGYTGDIALNVGVKALGATSRGSTFAPSDVYDSQVITVHQATTTISAQGTPFNALVGATGAASTAVVAHFTATPSGSASDFSATIDYGDGTTGNGLVVNSSAGGYDVVGTHTYKAAGSLPVTVTINGPGASTATATTTATVTGAQAAGNLVVGIADSPDPVTLGQPLTYTVVVNNRGSATTTGITLTDTLPAGVTFVSSSVTPSAVAGGVLTIPIGDLAPNASQTVTITVTPNLAGSIANSVHVSASTPAGTAADATETTTVVTTSSPGGGTTTTGGAPQVVDLLRRGILTDPTRIDLAFSTALDPTRAEDVRNYRLVSPGRDGKLGTADDRVVPIVSATYDATANVVTLSPAARLNWFDFAQLRIASGGATGLAGADGSALDGNGDGQAGGDYVVRFARGTYFDLAGRLARAQAIAAGQTDHGPVGHVMGAGTSVSGPSLIALLSNPLGASFRQAASQLPSYATERVSATGTGTAAGTVAATAFTPSTATRVATLAIPAGPDLLFYPNGTKKKAHA